MSEIKHVDIGRSGSGYAGTETDPYSWSDVRDRLAAVQAAAFDTGSVLDTGMSFDGAAINIDFKLRGVGNLFTAENQITFMNFSCSPGSRIAFSAANPSKYGFPVLRSPAAYGVGITAPSSTGALIRFVNPLRLNIRVSGLLLDLALPLASNGWRFIDVTTPTNSTLVFKNNIVSDNGYGNRLISFVGADSTSRVCAAHNTVLYGANSVGSHEFVRVEGCQLYSGRNIGTQSVGSTAVVTWTTATTSLYAGGSAYGLLSSSILYNGVSPQTFEPDAAGLDPFTQIIWNPLQIDATHEDPFTFIGSDGCSVVRSSAYWPVHSGAALGLGYAIVPTTISIEALDTDVFGRDRVTGYADAGAFQKTHLLNALEFHVDLSTSGLSNAAGSVDDPMTITDFLLDWTRRAPVDNAVTYLIRGRNDSSPLAEIDLGVLSPNTLALDRRYAGIGSITVAGWKASRRRLPILSAQKLRPNANVLVIFKSLKLEFANGGSANFIEPTVLSSARFVLANSVVRSRSSCAGRIASFGAGHAIGWIIGSSIHVQHTAGVSSGAFGASTSALNLELCAVNLPNTTVLGTGGDVVTIRCCVVNTGAAGTATWSGANIDAISQLNAAQPFVDPSNVDFDVADFALLDNSTAIGAAPYISNLTVDVRSFVEIDARELRRSAFPLGNEGLDAGAFEHDFYVPPAQDYYLDLSKTRSGTGKAGDRWSPADFENWARTVDALDRRVVVHAIRRGRLALNLPEIEANANGAIEVKAEQPNDPAAWYADDYEAVRGETTVPFKINGMIIGLDQAARLSDLPNAMLVVENSIVDKKHSLKQYRISVVGLTPNGDDVLQFIVGAATFSLQPNTSWIVATTLEGNAVAIGAAIATHGLEVRVTGANVDVIGADTISVGASPAMLDLELAQSLINGTADVIGSSIAEEFKSELGIETTLVSGTARISHCAFQGHQYSATTKTRYGVNAAGNVQNTGFYGCETNVAGSAATSGLVSAATHLFAATHSVDQALADFELNGSDLLGIADSSALPTWAAASTMDICGNLRFNTLITTVSDIDAGAIERSFIDSNGEYDGVPGDPIIVITDEGLQLNARALAGNVLFKLVGYVIGRGGYTYWDPTKPLTPQGLARPNTALISVGAGAWSNEVLTITTPAGVVNVAYGVDFEAGVDAAGTALNIADALRASNTFNSAAWVRVNNAVLEIRSWTFGAAAVGFLAARTGALLTVTQQFSGTVDADVVNGQAWPISGYAPWFKLEDADPRTRAFVSRLDFADANGSIGEIVAIAKVVSSPIPNEVGHEYAYARLRIPIHVKHSREIFVNRLMFTH
jgi:hypothetical protein